MLLNVICLYLSMCWKDGIACSILALQLSNSGWILSNIFFPLSISGVIPEHQLWPQTSKNSIYLPKSGTFILLALKLTKKQLLGHTRIVRKYKLAKVVQF